MPENEPYVKRDGYARTHDERAALDRARNAEAEADRLMCALVMVGARLDEGDVDGARLTVEGTVDA